MNWKEKLKEELNYRRIDYCAELYSELLQKMIRPAFKTIENELFEYQIDVISKLDELRIHYAHSTDCYSFKVELEDCKIKFSAYYWDISNPSFDVGCDSELINGYNRFVEFKEINMELIGEVFFESFQPIIHLYKAKEK